MATAGMGDVLTGVISGLLAQFAAGSAATAQHALQAAQIGVLVHALAGDSAAQGGQRGLLASDVIAELRGWVNP
jgi:NAD(P)H-hydrate epimerase